MALITDEKKQSMEDEDEQRAAWEVGSVCLVFSRSDSQWYGGRIDAIYYSETGSEANLSAKQRKRYEWLRVSYGANFKRRKRMQRHCHDLRPVTKQHPLSLTVGSRCLIHSSLVKCFVEGTVVKIFSDKEGEWLTIKYWDTNEHKLCEIQRYSPELLVFQRHLLWTQMVDTPTPPAPWQLLETNNLILPPKLSNVVRLSDNTLLVAAHSFETDTRDDGDDGDEEMEDEEQTGIYRYDIIRNRWSLMAAYPKGSYYTNHNISVDAKEEVLYLNNSAGGGGVWRLHLQSKRFEYVGEYTVASEKKVYTGYGSISCVVDGEYHVFWGKGNSHHLVWAPQFEQFDVRHEFAHIEQGMVSFGMVFNAKDNAFLLLGGYLGKGKDAKGRPLGRTDKVWRYALDEGEWEELQCVMPDKMQSFGCVITRDCANVIVFGGSDSQGISDKIHILDLDTLQWRLSRLRCPFKGIGYNNVVIAPSGNISNTDNVHILQSMYRHITCPLSEILAE